MSLRPCRRRGLGFDEVVPELECLGGRIAADFYVEAVRLANDLWEIQVTAL
jgi:hypothetical protein